jgi:O-antigen ligase
LSPAIRLEAKASRKQNPARMKNFVNLAILVGVVLSMVLATVFFGAVSFNYAAPILAIGVVLGLLWTLKLCFTTKVSWVRSPMHWAVAAFVLYALIRYWTSPLEYFARAELFLVGYYAAIYFVVANNLHRRRDLTIVFLALMVLALGQSVYGLWQYVSKSDSVLFAVRPEDYHGRASGTYVCPNHLAGFLEMAFGIILARIILHRPDISGFGAYVGPKLIEGYVAVVVLLAILGTDSRGSWFAIAISLLGFFVWAWSPGQVSKFVLLGLIAFGVLLGVSAFSLPSVRERLEKTFVPPPQEEQEVTLGLRDTTIGLRTYMWSATRRMIADHPFFGTGPGSWEWVHQEYREAPLQGRARYAHNDVLQLASDYGLVGALLVVGALGCFYWHAGKLSSHVNFSDQRAFAVGVAFAVTAMLVHSLIDFNLHIPANALLLVVLMALAISLENGTSHSVRVLLQRRQQLILGGVVLILTCLAGWAGWKLTVPRLLIARADDASAMEQWDEAMALYNRAAKMDPKNPFPALKQAGLFVLQAEQFKDAADSDLVAIRTNFVARAHAEFTRAIQLNPYDIEAYLGQARAHVLAGQDDKALESFERAIAMDPNNAMLRVRLGEFHRWAGRKESAIAAFNQAMELRPWLNEAYTNLVALGVAWKPPEASSDR